MPIDWGDTSSADVKDYLDAHPAPGFDWDGFWNKVLWFGEPPDKLAHDVDQGFATLTDNMKAAGVPTSSDIWGGMATADRNLEGGIKDTWDAVTGWGPKAAGDAANSTLTAVAPYLLVAGLIWVAVEVRRAR